MNCWTWLGSGSDLARQFKPAPVSSMMDENLAAYGSRRMIGAIDAVVSMARWVVCVVDERLFGDR